MKRLILLACILALGTPATARVTKTWNDTSYEIPEAGDRNWATLSDFLSALADNAQTTSYQIAAVRVATTTPVTVDEDSDFAIVTELASAGAVTVNLPAGADGQMFVVVDGTGDAATNNVTIDANASETINGASTYVINVDRGGVALIFDGTEWKVLTEFTGGTAGTGVIARDKIAAGTADHVVINDASGDLSSEAQLAVSRGGTGQSTATAGFDALSPTTTQGDLVVHGASSSERLAVGSANTVLRSDGTDPSWGQITDDNVSSSAAIARSKVADGTASHVLINDATGALSSEATLSKSRGGAGADMSSVTFPSTGTIVTEAGTQDLSSKTFTDALTLQEQSSSPSNPSSGDKKLYCKDDGSCYTLNSDGEERALGSGAGGSGGINYLEGDNSNFDINEGDWTFFDDGAVTEPVDGTGNDAATDGITCTRINSTDDGDEVLNPEGSLKIARTAAAKGQGCSVEIQIPKAYAGRKHPVSFPMDSSFADEDLGTWVYCSTATPSLIEIRAQGDDDALMDAIPRTYQGSFIAPADDSLYETTGYITCRAIIMSVVTTADAASMVIDDVEIGPGNGAVGVTISPWKSYTPVTQGLGTLSDVNLEWRQVPEGIEIRGYFTIGTVSGVEIQLGLPNSYTVGEPGSDTVDVGTFQRDEAYSDGQRFLALATNGDTFLNVGRDNSGSSDVPMDPISGTLWTSSTRIAVRATVRVAELAGKGTTNYITSADMNNPLVYEFDDWNPSGTGSVTTQPSSGDTVSTNADVDVSGPSTGIVTFTFGRTAYYMVSASVGHKHAEGYSLARFSVVLGGTADRLGQMQDSNVWAYGDDTDNSDENVTRSFIIRADQGETFTFKPSFESNGLTSADSHTVSASVVIQPLDAVGRSLAYDLATDENYGLVKKNKWQRKTLTSSVSTDGEITDLTFDNLTVGNTYEVHLQAQLNVNNGGDDATARVEITHDSVVIGQVQVTHTEGSSALGIQTAGTTVIFTATDTSLTFVGASLATSTSSVGGTASESPTFAILKEIESNYVETDEW